MSLHIVHTWQIPPRLDDNTERRIKVAHASWEIAKRQGEWTSIGTRTEDLPRTFWDNDRHMAYVKSIFHIGWKAASKIPGSLILYTNTDTHLSPNIYNKIADVMKPGVEAFYGPRRDFQRIDTPLTDDQIALGRDYCGTDVFAFTPEWWDKWRDSFPDCVLGAESWDCALYRLMEKCGCPKVYNLIAHEAHGTRWCSQSNRGMLPSQRHSLYLTSAFLGKIGVKWERNVFGAIPEWKVEQPHGPVTPPAPSSDEVNMRLDWHLGDCLIHSNWLRKVALANPQRKFNFFIQDEYRAQVQEFVADAKNIVMGTVGHQPGNSVDVWKNAGSWFDRHPQKLNWPRFHLHHFQKLAQQIGVQNPITRPDDLLFDSPAIQKDCGVPGKVDVLVLNSRPGSGQFKPWTPDYLDPVILALMSKGLKVMTSAPNGVGAPCTQDSKLTAAGIANLSLRTPTIIAVATGIHFPTASIWNRDIVKTRIVMIDNGESHAGMPHDWPDVRTREQAVEILVKKGIL